MKIVHTKAYVVCAAKGGKKVPVKGVCDLCDTPNVFRIGFGAAGTVSCVKCLRAALVELVQATGDRLVITTEIDGTEQTTRVNVSPYEENDE